MTNADVDPKIIKESSIVISIPNDVEYYLGKEHLRKEQLAEEVQRIHYNAVSKMLARSAIFKIENCWDLPPTKASVERVTINI